VVTVFYTGICGDCILYRNLWRLYSIHEFVATVFYTGILHCVFISRIHANSFLAARPWREAKSYCTLFNDAVKRKDYLLSNGIRGRYCSVKLKGLHRKLRCLT
jgi:hypothetical protein